MPRPSKDEPLRRDARAILDAALAAADPRAAMRRALRFQRGRLAPPDGASFSHGTGRVSALALGKAAAAMAAEAEAILGERLSGGVAVTKDGHGVPCARVRVLEAGHPVPDARSVRGAEALLAEAAALGPGDLALVLLSGGGSALACAPAEGLTLADKVAATRALLASGADIGAVNAVRKHLSRFKGGRLGEALRRTRTIALVVSDVIGDDLATIASGPVSPDPTTYRDALEVLARYRIDAPAPVRSALEEGARGARPETPKSAADLGDARAYVIASNADALRAAAGRARELGYETRVLPEPVRGEARLAGERFGRMARELRAAAREGPLCVLAGGETTVTLRGGGKGGRNQELATACALEIAGLEGVAFLSAGTDGTDGPTDAAGGLVDGATRARALAAGRDGLAALAANDTYCFLDAAGDLLRTGPTRTNVMDVQALLVGKGT